MSKTKLFIISVFLLSNLSSVYAQDKTIDSLRREILNSKIHDTIKLSKLGQLIDQIPSNTKDTKILNDNIGRIASKNLKNTKQKDLNIVYTKYLAAYYNNLSVQSQEHKNTVKTFEYLDKSIALFKSVGADYEMNYTLVSKGIAYSQINEYKKAISCLFTALRHFENDKKDNDEGIAYVNSVIGSVYSDQGDYEKAIESFKKTIKYYENKQNQTGEEKYVASTVYANCGSAYLLLKKYPAANHFFNKALQSSKEIQDNTTMSIILNKLSQVKIEQGKFNEAASLLNEALKTDDSELSKANTYINLGDLYYRKNNTTEAESYLSKGFSISKEIKNEQLQEKASYLLLNIYKKTNNYKKALELHEFRSILKDSNDIEASKNELAQQQLKYDFEKKQLNLELEAEKKASVKNNWLIALTAALLLVLLVWYFYYRNNKQKEEITQLEKERIKQKLLLSQMNPHFIFNSIDNIQSLIMNKKEETAISYLDRFSKLTRQILENSNENYISLEEELDMIENYLSVQQLLYNSKFDYTINTENIDDTENYFIPPMLAQPFIENAIKHGIRNKKEQGMIHVKFSLNHDRLMLEVSDNGSGFNDDKSESSHKSMAMKITKERLLNYTQNKGFEILADNQLDAEGKVIGARVISEIPYICEN